MSEELRVLVEVIFNVAYLITLWTLVMLMKKRNKFMQMGERGVSNSLLWAFLLLAVGDTGHVGFRVIAFLLGGLEKNRILVGLGALATALTITLFYVFLLEAWRRRFKGSYGWFEDLLFLAAFSRLLIMAFPQNEWSSIVPPFTWSLYRNIPLIILGLGTAYLILRDSIRFKDRVFLYISIMIFLSYAFYLPVILFVQKYQALGMLMIPKTLAYLGMAVIAYTSVFKIKVQ